MSFLYSSEAASSMLVKLEVEGSVGRLPEDMRISVGRQLNRWWMGRGYTPLPRAELHSLTASGQRSQGGLAIMTDIEY